MPLSRRDFLISGSLSLAAGAFSPLVVRAEKTKPNTPADFKRENPKEVSQAYQQHILGGIKWALGLEQGDARPQTIGKK